MWYLGCLELSFKCTLTVRVEVTDEAAWPRSTCTAVLYVHTQLIPRVLGNPSARSLVGWGRCGLHISPETLEHVNQPDFRPCGDGVRL